MTEASASRLLQKWTVAEVDVPGQKDPFRKHWQGQRWCIGSRAHNIQLISEVLPKNAQYGLQSLHADFVGDDQHNDDEAVLYSKGLFNFSRYDMSYPSY